jgi:hypothetical protein
MILSRNLLFVLLLLTVSIATTHGQAQTGSETSNNVSTAMPTVNSGTVINYSFSTNKMDVLPFDKPFVFHLTDFPTTADSFTSVRIKVIQLSNKNAKPNSQHIVVQDDPSNPNIIYETTEWKRTDPKTTVATVDIPFTSRLPPSRAYQVQISLVTTRELTDGEKKTLAGRLEQSRELDTTFNNLVKQSLNAAATASSNFLLISRAELAAQLKLVVKTMNPEYDLRDSIPVPYFGTFRNALGNLKGALKKLEADNLNAAQLATISTDLDTENFYTLGQTSKLQTDITQFVSNAPSGILPTTANDLAHLQIRLDSVLAVSNRLKRYMIDHVIIPNVFLVNPLSETYNPDFVTNSKFYINLDVGFAYVWRIDRAMAYSGFNIYFRPVDKTIPLSSYSGWDVITTRTSLLIGISLSSVAKANVRKGLIGDNAFILGGGFKLNPFLKVNGGWFMHYRYDPDPLVTQNSYHFSMSPFVSLSLDLDVKPLFSGLSDSIFK